MLFSRTYRAYILDAESECSYDFGWDSSINSPRVTSQPLEGNHASRVNLRQNKVQISITANNQTLKYRAQV